MKKTKFQSIKIINDKVHLAFINEIYEALKVAGIAYTTKIEYDSINKYSMVVFYTKTQKACNYLAALVELVSGRDNILENIGGEFIKEKHKGK